MKKIVLVPEIVNKILADTQAQLRIMCVLNIIDVRTVKKAVKRNDPILTQYGVLLSLSEVFAMPLQSLITEV